MRRSGDEAASYLVQVIGLATLLSGVILPAVMLPQPALRDSSGDKLEAAQVQQEVADLLDAGDIWCCPDDPSSPSWLQDAATDAWAGDEDRFAEIFTPWLSEPSATGLVVRMGWQPMNEAPLVSIALYATGQPPGQAVGAQRFLHPAERGPAYVVPPLENVTPEASMDVHFLPISKWWPYRVGPTGEHGDWLETTIHYSHSSRVSDGEIPTMRQRFTELSGAPTPAIDLHFAEPPWQTMIQDAQTSQGGIETEDYSPEFSQVLTKEDLTAERLLDNDEELDDGTDLLDTNGTTEDGVYPLHQFHLNATLHGPGAVSRTNDPTLEEWTATTVSDAYRLTVHVPRRWTDVQFTELDLRDNEDFGWSNASIEAVPGGGGHTITALLDVRANYTTLHKDADGDLAPRFVLDAAEEIEAPFTFHARAPSDSQQDELGFQRMTARLQSTQWRYHQEATMTIELAQDTGRVHRTLKTHAPRIVPPTQINGHGSGVQLPIGVTLLNGGESVEIEKIVWRAPDDTFLEGEIDPITGPQGDDEDLLGEWQVQDERTITWTPGTGLLDQGDNECLSMDACTIAANVRMDGSELNPWGRWKTPRLVSLYDTEDVPSYLSWFVRSDRAWRGVLPGTDVAAGFALANQHIGAGGGSFEGAFKWTVPPSTDAACNEQQIQQRNRATSARRPDGRIHYDFGPREDGVPVIGSDLLNTTQLCSAGALADRSFVFVGQAGGRWGVDAIGQAQYNVVDTVPSSTFQSWRDGVAESRIEGPTEVTAGESPTFRVIVDSLFERLVDQGAGNVSVRLEVLDPYNAWERTPWEDRMLVYMGKPHVYETDVPEAEEPDIPEFKHSPLHSPDPSCDPPDDRVECQQYDDPDTIGEPDPLPSRFDVEQAIPAHTLPGTHLLVLEVHWVADLDSGAVPQTARVLHPFDVLLKEGRAMPATIEALAWSHDWG